VQRDVRALRRALDRQSAVLARAVADLDVQFKRIAQIQAELDGLRKANGRGPV